MFHEMAHQKLYVADDSSFNESYAEAVSRIGVRLWFEKDHRQQPLARYNHHLLQKDEFFKAVKIVQKNLADIYASEMEDKEKEMEKQRILAKAAVEYGGLANGWFNKNLNNAKLGSVNTYNSLVLGMMRIYNQQNHNVMLFHQEMERLGKGSREERMKILQDQVVDN